MGMATMAQAVMDTVALHQDLMMAQDMITTSTVAQEVCVESLPNALYSHLQQHYSPLLLLSRLGPDDDDQPGPPGTSLFAL